MKKLRDFLNRGSQINLQIFGELLFNLGLNATKEENSNKDGIRVATPSIVKWKDSFALVIKSSQKVLTLVSPSEGIISIDIEKVSNFFDKEFRNPIN